MQSLVLPKAWAAAIGMRKGLEYSRTPELSTKINFFCFFGHAIGYEDRAQAEILTKQLIEPTFLKQPVGPLGPMQLSMCICSDCLQQDGIRKHTKTHLPRQFWALCFFVQPFSQGEFVLCIGFRVRVRFQKLWCVQKREDFENYGTRWTHPPHAVAATPREPQPNTKRGSLQWQWMKKNTMNSTNTNPLEYIQKTVQTLWWCLAKLEVAPSKSKGQEDLFCDILTLENHWHRCSQGNHSIDASSCLRIGSFKSQKRWTWVSSLHQSCKHTGPDQGYNMVRHLHMTQAPYAHWHGIWPPPCPLTTSRLQTLSQMLMPSATLSMHRYIIWICFWKYINSEALNLWTVDDRGLQVWKSQPNAAVPTLTLATSLDLQSFGKASAPQQTGIFGWCTSANSSVL